MSTKGKDAEIFNLGAILSNIPGQEYAFGSSYYSPRRWNEGEHFILCPFRHVETRHCRISVDEEGEFWITNLDESAKTSVNRNPIHFGRKRKLNFGDIISFGAGNTAFSYFEFKERKAEERKILKPKTRRVKPFADEAFDVGNNHVIVQNILKHFSVTVLKEYRFVSKAWNSAASQLLRKRCAVSIPASPQHEQTKLFRCAKEMEGFPSNMTSLSVEIPTFSHNFDGDQDAEKFVKDLLKYQLKPNLTYFKLSASMIPSVREARLLDKVLQKVSQACRNLEHLALKISLEGNSFPFPQEGSDSDSDSDFDFDSDSDSDSDYDPDWSFGPNLKILEVLEGKVCPEFARSILQKVDTRKIEKFISRSWPHKSIFLAVLPEYGLRNLKEMSFRVIDEDDLGTLETLATSIPLQILVLHDIHGIEKPENSQKLSNILDNFSKTLVSLTIDCSGGNVVLPRFEKLEVLNLTYDEESGVTLPQNFLYSTSFPKLKSLTLYSSKIGSDGDGHSGLSDYTKAEALAQWGLNEGLFNSFLQVCSSLKELDIPHCPPEAKGKNKEYSERLKGMRTLFPNVKGKWIKGGK